MGIGTGAYSNNPRQLNPCQDQADVQEVGRVLSVGDGIARIYGLKGVKAAHAFGDLKRHGKCFLC